MSEVYVSAKKKSKKKVSSKVGSSTVKKIKTKNKYKPKLLKKKHSLDHRPISAYRLFPYRAEFFNKDLEEKVVLLLRRHPITNLRWITLSIVMLLVPSFLTVIPIFEALPLSYQIVLVISWYLVVVAYMFEKFLGWYFNVNIITDERLFDINFIHLIYREMTDANIDQIQDVTVEMGGSIRTMFNYGDVVIQTASEKPRIRFEAVPFPDKVARVLRELRIEEQIEALEGRIR